jgi:hypothetical protein
MDENALVSSQEKTDILLQSMICTIVGDILNEMCQFKDFAQRRMSDGQSRAFVHNFHAIGRLIAGNIHPGTVRQNMNAVLDRLDPDDRAFIEPIWAMILEDHKQRSETK